jgi:DNA-binding Lrp family transcriptional regulator
MQPLLDDTDRRLLDLLQREVPLTPRPYEELGRQLGLSEDDVLARVRHLSGERTSPIRQISAIFDSRALGYKSCLVAARIHPQHLDAAAAVINQHPGVSHNYKREHDYNLWFTLAVPPDSVLGLDGTLAVLRELGGAEQVRALPTLKLYKIGVRFDLGAGEIESGGAAIGVREEPPPFDATDIDRRMIRVLQQHLPPEPRPFDAWAREAGTTVEQLLAAAARYQEIGVMRRFSAVLRHRQVGVSANAMGVWIVPPDRRDAFGALAAEHPAVSHCYLRPTYPDWPYSVFTMVHGKSRDECEAVLAQLSQTGGIREYASLYSTVEYKKVRVKYFTGDIEHWESTHPAAPAPDRLL